MSHPENKIMYIIYAATAHLILLILLFNFYGYVFIKPKIESKKVMDISQSKSIEQPSPEEVGGSNGDNKPLELPKVEDDLMEDIPEHKAPNIPVSAPQEIQEEKPPEAFLPENNNDFPNIVPDRVHDFSKSFGKAKNAAVKDGVNVGKPGTEGSRTDIRTGKGLSKAGGDDISESAVELGLQWLSTVQDDDGKWNIIEYCKHYSERPDYYKEGIGYYQYNPGITGLCMLAFSGAGYSNTQGKYEQVLEKAKAWLISIQNNDGALDSARLVSMYNHAIATLALADLYTVSKDDSILQPLRQAIKYLLSQQNANGGWTYTPQYNGSIYTRSDLSISGWCVLALTAAKQCGINIPTDALDKLNSLFSSFMKNGQAIYADEPPGTDRTGSAMTAVSALCRRLLGESAKSYAHKNQVNYFSKNLPDFNQLEGVYYWYYASINLYVDRDEYPKEWETWNLTMRREVMRSQELEGSRRGSFMPADFYATHGGGRLYSTAMSILCLEVYYRISPSYLTVLDHEWK